MSKNVKLAFNAYSIIEDAVENGARWGYLHAYKHLADEQHPTEEALVQHIVGDVMNELCEKINFDKSGVSGMRKKSKKTTKKGRNADETP